MPNQKHIQILLADDDKDDRFFFRKALEMTSIATNVDTVENGEALLNYLSKGKENFPDVLFLDVNMPRKNGMECLTEIKANKKIKDFPIVIYSTSVTDPVADLFFEKGAYLYLRKCDFNALVESLTFVLSQIKKGVFVKQTREKFIFNLKAR